MNRLAEQARADAGLSLRHRRRWPGGQSCSSRTAATRTTRARCPGDYRKILAIVREAGGPVQVRAVGGRLGLDASVHGKLEPLRAKMTKLAARGWLHKRGDGRFTARS
ncbi:hypothetical protein ACGF3G_08960 [Streptomyces sp. NPDC048179]|uniref:hypothetical protein n=1 Tax=Streptomyces sp. NPDC048179 TaxID=3365506 RepID=UPI003714263B